VYIRRLVSAAAIAASIFSASGAFAQSGSEVVVMRRSLDPKTRTYAWVPGEWSQCSNSCGAGQQTRPVQCMMNGKRGSPDVNCGPNRPADVQSCYDVQACSYTWNPSEWSDVKGCGQVVETRTLTCDRSDGQVVANDQCPTPAPDTARTVNDLRTCSYSWKAEDWGSWSDYCRTGAERARQVYCLRSNGEKVGDDFCAQEGAKPSASETADRYEQCGYAWDAKEWEAWSSTCQTAATRTRQVTCRRSNGDAVADAMCASAGDKPQLSEAGDRYEGCSYSWKPGAFGAIAPACGPSQSTRTVECLRSNGDVVADASCDAGTRPSEIQAGTDYSTCSYDWNEGAWSPPSSSCGSATSTRSVTCRSSDGRTVPDGSCTTAKPDTSKTTYETSGCGHSWKTDGWSASVPACGATVQNRNVWCLRSDGQTVSDAACEASSRPASQQGATDYGTCTYGWSEGAWSAPSTTCGQATYTRSVTCLSSDGRTVSDSSCSGQKPDATKSDYQTSGCGYSWNAGAFGSPVPACGPTVQNRPVSCLRSDGQTVADGSCDAGARPSPQQPATDYSTCTYGWSVGSYGAWSASCGSATQTRAVSCQSSDGRTVADSFCSTAKPESSQSSYQTDGCARTWNVGAWGSPDSGCSAAAVQTRAVTCQRSDGQVVADAECTTAKPGTTQTVANYGACAPYWYAASGWTDWNSHCSASAVRSRDIGCFRYEERCVQGSANYWSDAGGGNCYRKIDDAQCSARPDATRAGYGPGLNNTESAAVYDQCGYSWQADPWSAPAAACGATTQSRVTWCLRSDGTRVMDMYCQQAGLPQPTNTQGATDYSTCSFSWQAGGWSAPSTTCGSATQTRDVWCLRSDGTRLNPINDAACGGNRPAASQASYQTGSCSYARVSPTAWSGWDNACSGTANRTRTYSCQRSDGAIVDGSECAARGISLSETETGANYTNACPGYFSVSGWTDYNSHCSASATRTRSVACYRSGDNVFAGDQYCTDRGVAVPTRSETTAVYDGCGYTWSTGGWGAPAAACGASARYRAVWCTRSDGATVAEGNCNPGTRPPDGEGVTDYSACSYAWAYNGWGTTSQTCGSVSQARSVWCQRSDGATVAEGYCNAGARPAASQSYADYSACTYARGDYTGSTDWNSHCSPTAYRYNYYNCKRADGAVVANAECTNRGISLTEQQGGSVLDQCGYSVSAWSGYSYASSCSASTTATQYATGCRRSDGADVAVAECSNRGIPTTQSVQTSNLSGCGYTWQAGGWSGQQAVCTTGTEYRDVWCQRTDGARVDGSLCGGGQPANAQGYSNANACGYSWYQSGFSGWNSACSSSATRTQTVYCRRSDGAQVADGYCGGGKPASSESTPIYSGCSYSAGYGGWSACPAGANATQSRSTSCTRVQTGEPVDQQTYCGIPATQTQGCTINPGGYAPGTTLGTYAFQTCSQQYDYGTQGTMPGINPAQCRTGVATYAQQCTGGGNFATNANCTGKPYVNNPRGPSGYPCDIVCR